MGDPSDSRFTSADAEIIRFKVKKLVGHYGFTASDETDLQQELAMHVSKRMEKHDPTRGARSTFVDRIVSNKIASIIAHRVAQKRDVRKERVLDTEDGIPQVGHKRNEKRMDLKLDVAEAVARLPEDLQGLARRLMLDQKAEVGRATNLTPQQMKTAVARIAQHFREMGFDPNS